MHEINSPGSVAGKFVDEDEETNTPGAILWAKWLNTMQAENMAFLTAMGVTPDENQNDQVFKCVAKMVAGTDLIARFTTTGNIALTGLGTQGGGDWGVALTAGNMILVKNQAVPQDNGWYMASGGTWPRVEYLDSSAEITPGKLTKVTEGLVLADSMWMLTTDAPIVLNASPLVFERKDGGLRHLVSGTPLPGTNIGPIWHDDYNSIMTWQAFTANGAAYTGYASVLVGGLLSDTQPTPRLGYVKSGTANLNRLTYAGLRGWAMHNGIMVASGVWAAGQIAVSDNVDGTTFRIFDVRGEFPRYWDDGRGIDAARAFGSKQIGTIVAADFDGTAGYSTTAGALPPNPSTDRSQLGWDIPQTADYSASLIVPFGAAHSSTFAFGTTPSYFGVTRPRNTALLASIKF